jgi:hypothetical protein
VKWFALFFVILFLYFGYATADYQDYFWTVAYYGWDKNKDFILALTVISLLRPEEKRLRHSWIALCCFLACRVIWEAIIIVWPQDINNPQAIFYLFILAWAVIMYIILHDWIISVFLKIKVWIKNIKQKFSQSKK